MTRLTRDAAQEIIDTKMAPWVNELNIQVEAVGEKGTATLRMPYGDHLARHGGVVSGQSMLAFADAAMVVVISAALGEFRNMATVDMTTSFMSPARNTDIVCTGEIVKRGKRMVFGRMLLSDSEDTPIAHIATTWMLIG